MKKFILFMVLFTLIVPVGGALELGKIAPELEVSQWVKNGSAYIGAGKKNKIFVIQFWATWCPPCVSIIPYLSNIQRKYKAEDVEVVAITKEDAETVIKFVKQQTRMDYHVAIDKKGKTNELYMAGIDSLPTAFVIDKKGIVVWRGHPMELDKVLPQVIAGTFDHLAYQKLDGLQEKFKLAMQMRQIDEATKLADQILFINPNNWPVMQFRLMVFKQRGQHTAAIAFLQSLIRKFPGNESAYFIKLGLLRQEDPKKIKTCAEEILNKFSENPAIMNRLAWDLLENSNFGNQPLRLALTAAQKGFKMTHPKDKPALAANSDTLARCYYSIGRIDKAIEFQNQALTLAKGTETEKMLKKTLNFYRMAEKLGAEIE